MNSLSNVSSWFPAITILYSYGRFPEITKKRTSLAHFLPQQAASQQWQSGTPEAWEHLRAGHRTRMLLLLHAVEQEPCHSKEPVLQDSAAPAGGVKPAPRAASNTTAGLFTSVWPQGFSPQEWPAVRSLAGDQRLQDAASHVLRAPEQTVGAGGF